MSRSLPCPQHEKRETQQVASKWRLNEEGTMNPVREVRGESLSSRTLVL